MDAKGDMVEMLCLTPTLQLAPRPSAQLCADTAKGGGHKGRLIALVATHNRKSDLIRALDALLINAPQDLSAVIVVDNASSDGTWAMLCNHPDPRLLPIRAARNLVLKIREDIDHGDGCGDGRMRS